MVCELFYCTNWFCAYKTSITFCVNVPLDNSVVLFVATSPGSSKDFRTEGQRFRYQQLCFVLLLSKSSEALQWHPKHHDTILMSLWMNEIFSIINCKIILMLILLLYFIITNLCAILSYTVWIYVEIRFVLCNSLKQQCR